MPPRSDVMSQLCQKGVSVVCAAITLLLSACYRDPPELRAFMFNYAMVDGHVTELECGNHGAFSYAFELNGQTYTGREHGGPVNCPFDKEGKRIDVYYYPPDPRVHNVSNPADLYAAESGYYMPTWAFVLIGLAVIFIGSLSGPIKARIRKKVGAKD